MATIYELRAGRGAGTFAILYESGRRCRAVQLPDGAIAESPSPDRRCEAPGTPPDLFEVGAGGVAATTHSDNLGLVIGHLRLAGVFALPSGRVAAVCWAEAVPLGMPLPSST